MESQKVSFLAADTLVIKSDASQKKNIKFPVLPTRFAHKSLLFFHSKSLFGEFLSAMLYLCDTRYTLLFTSALTPFQVFWRPVDLCGFIEEQKLRMKSLKYLTRVYTQMFQLQVQLMYSSIHKSFAIFFATRWRTI